MTAADSVRIGLLIRTLLEVLSEATQPLSPTVALSRVGDRIGSFTEYEREKYNGQRQRWENILSWRAGDMTTVGWMSKTGGWRVTDSGRQALATYPDDEALRQALYKLWKQVDTERKRAFAQLAPQEREIAALLSEVAAGQWTSYDDIAAFAGTDPDTVASFLAKQRVPNAHRVLHSDGTPPREGMLHQGLRGDDLRDKLAAEGVDFDADGRADPQQRVTAADLRAHHAELSRVDQDGRQPSAWLVRGTVDGHDLVPRWLADGYVSLAASRLPATVAPTRREAVEEAVREAYSHKSYAQQERLVREFDAFLRQMRPDDYVATVTGGKLHLGRLAGDYEFVAAPDDQSNLRRPVEWLRPEAPVDYSALGEQLVNKLGDQSHVVNLTDVLDLVTQLADRPREVRTPVAKPAARLAPVTDALAEELFLHDPEWLRDVAELLADKRQLVLYGPPGTGKTYLATRLAEHLAGAHEAVKLVQFHPSYTYEDFFEGYRPKLGTGGQLGFELRPGPLRSLADRAHDDPATPYLLVIDEINRANLAKVFGELYFLLEYRERSIGLQYSPDHEFTLPKNLYVIGTMNTADRSIARFDAAMRRRFAFVEMHPRGEPVAGLLRRWLAHHGHDDEPAQLLAALNAELSDHDYAIGPSYLMRPAVYERDRGLERVWRSEILPLLEELHYGDGVDVADAYGLATLRSRVASAPPQ